MRVTQIEFESSVGCKIVATRHLGYIEIQVGDIRERMSPDYYSGLYKLAKTILTDAGEEYPSPEQLRNFCEAMHCMMSEKDVVSAR